MTHNRGFGAMDKEKQRSIAILGGKSVSDENRSFSRNRELAARAGRKGGSSVPDEKRSFSQDKELATKAGRKGGGAVHKRKRSFSVNRALAAEAGRKGGQGNAKRLLRQKEEAGGATENIFPTPESPTSV